MSEQLKRWFVVHKGDEVFGILETDYVGDDAGTLALSGWSTGLTASMANYMFHKHNLRLGEWVWHVITQPEFETYRDLHGFMVIELDK